MTLLILPLSDGASAVGSEESGEKLCVVSIHTLSIETLSYNKLYCLQKLQRHMSSSLLTVISLDHFFYHSG